MRRRSTSRWRTWSFRPVLRDDVVVDNLTPDGQAKLKAWQSVPGMDPLWPLSLALDGWTTYDPNTVPAGCKGA